MFEAFSAVLGLCYILLAAREYRLAWIFWLISSVSYFFVFIQAGLFAGAGLQIFFILSACYGYVLWTDSREESAMKIHEITPLTHLGLFVLGVCLGLILAFVARSFEGAEGVYADGLISSFSIIASVLTARKVLSCWLYWITINIGALSLYFYQQLYFSSGLYLVFALAAVHAFRQWKAGNANNL
jgi:nicotinamide mononucleotide transporter